MVTPQKSAAWIPGGRLGNESGFMIVLALLVLFTLTLLGVTSIINSTIETKISANVNFANQSMAAADSGLNHALTELNNNSITISDSDYDNPSWRYPSSDYITRDLGGSDDYISSGYQWYMRFKPDTQDLDNDSSTTVIYFNDAFGYTSSMFSAGEGYPVIEILSEGYVSPPSGGSNQSVTGLALDLGRNQFDVTVKGGITSRSSVNATGNVTISGLNHDLDGNEGGSCGTDMPGVFVDEDQTVTQGGSADIEGNPASEVNDGTITLPTTPWGYLGIDQADFESFFTSIDAQAAGYTLSDLSGNVWVNKVYSEVKITSNLSLSGILVVHNQHFDPDVWECSNPASPTYKDAVGGCYNPSDPVNDQYKEEADSSNVLYDPDYSPAEFEMAGTGIYKGVIIADTVVKFSGNPTVIGAVISLSSLGVQHTGTGNASLLYSCEAVQNVTTQKYATKLVWRRL